MPSGENYHDLKGLLRGLNLNTVCEEARCPNIGDCWDQRTATVMILGDVCTRACGFCAIKTGRPTWFDDDEPRRVAEAVAAMHLDHVVVTSVARDDLPDGGAGAFAATIRELRGRSPADGRRGPDPGLQRRRGPAARRHGGRAGHPQPQPRDGPPPPEAGPQAGPLGPEPGRPRAGEGVRAGPRARGPHQELADGRPRRDPGRAHGGVRGAPRGRHRHPHDRPVPAPDDRPPAARALLPPRRVRRDEGRAPSPSASSTSSRARSSGPATTRATRSRARSSGASAARRRSVRTGRVVPGAGRPEILPACGANPAIAPPSERQGAGDIEAPERLHQRLEQRADRHLGRAGGRVDRHVARIAEEDRDRGRLAVLVGDVDVRLVDAPGRAVEPQVAREPCPSPARSWICPSWPPGISLAMSLSASFVGSTVIVTWSESTPLRDSLPTTVTVMPGVLELLLELLGGDVGQAGRGGIGGRVREAPPRPPEEAPELLGRAELDPPRQVARDLLAALHEEQREQCCRERALDVDGRCRRTARRHRSCRRRAAGRSRWCRARPSGSTGGRCPCRPWCRRRPRSASGRS